MTKFLGITAAIAAIVDDIHPRQIILFGSRARGDARPDSDLDLLIIERESFAHRSRRSEIARIRRLLKDLDCPKDILVFDEEEARRWRQAPNHVVARAMREGIVLYEQQ